MTLLEIDLTTPAADGVFVPARGVLRFTPTQRRTLNDAVVLPVPFQVPLTLGMAQVDLAANDLTWVWRIDEHVSGAPSRTIYANIPDALSASYADLVPLDPASLAPVAPLAPAWAEPLAELTERLDVGTVTPDPDNPGFYLIGVPSA